MIGKAIGIAFASWFISAIGVVGLARANISDVSTVQVGCIVIFVVTVVLNTWSMRLGSNVRRLALAETPIARATWAHGTLARISGTIGFLGSLAALLLLLATFLPVTR